MSARATSPALRDLARVTVLVGAFWLMAMHFEFSETLAYALQNYEKFQLDEMPLTLLVLSISLAWFAFRRISEVSELLTSNRYLTQRLLTAQEDERRILSQELHDEVGQACTALRIEAAYIAKAIHSNPDAALKALQRIDQSSLHMHSLARDMLKRLRPPNLDSLGFEASLRELCDGWEQQGRIKCHTLIDELRDKLSDHLCTSLYRVTQEALTNIAKHAQATQVWIGLNIVNEVLTLSITDNGHGLAPSQTSPQGLGLVGMRERIASLHGHIRFEDAQPGLRIHVQVPLQEAHA
jgi:two-component system, NarL family, sensor histidine kinase FusK